MGHPAARATDPIGIIRPTSLSIGEALEQWDKYLAGKSRAESTRQQYRELWNRVRDQLGWVTIDQINKRELQAWMATQRKDAGGTWSGNTHDHAGVAFRSFGMYLEVSELVERNPLRLLEACGDEDDEGARAATTEEAQVMIASSLARTLNNPKAKGNRPLYWLTMFHLGLRWSEPGRLLVMDLRLNDDVPGIQWNPKRQKNRKKQWVPVRTDLAEMLRLYIAHEKLTPESPLFPTKPTYASWHADREHAKIPLEDEYSLEFKGHSARKWFATTLDETGCTAAERHKLLRHADGTADRYTKPDQAEMLKKVERLPVLVPKDLRVDLIKKTTIVSLSRPKVPKSGYTEPATPMPSTPSITDKCDRFSNAEANGVATERPDNGRRSHFSVMENGAVSGTSQGQDDSLKRVMPIIHLNQKVDVRVLDTVNRLIALADAGMKLLQQGAGHGAGS